MEPELSIVIPAYNEEGRIRGSLEKIRKFLAAVPLPAEVLVVDDGSRDGTSGLIEQFRSHWPELRLIRNLKNEGKGYSVRRGALEARGKRILFTDADLSTPIEEYMTLQCFLEYPFGIVIASRALEDSRVVRHQLWYREIMGKTFNKIMHLFLKLPFQDTQCGFKLLTRETVQLLFPKLAIRGFAFDVELLWLARKFKVPVREVPVSWINSPVSRVHPLLHSLQMLRDLARIRWNDGRGRYA